MPSKIRVLTFAVAFVCLPVPGFTAELQLSDVLRSSSQHYPKIAAALAKQDIATAKAQEAQGAFDLRLDGDTMIRGSGYYDGDYAGARLVKPIAPFGGEVYTGYRYGRGDFPIYEDELRTRDKGEANVGIVFSLLRNRDIDDRRFKLADAGYERELANLDATLTRFMSQLGAQSAYAEWLAAGRILKVYRELLDLAEERQRNLDTRVKAGDAARIVSTENQQNLLKRQALLNEAQRDFVARANDLSLYWRDSSGTPLVAGLDQLPAKPSDTGQPRKLEAEDLQRVFDSRPELRAFAVTIEQERNRVRIGENNLLPKVDVGLKAAQDQGDGLRRLGGTEAIASVKLSVPLQRNLGEGQIGAAKAKVRQLENDQRLAAEKIQVELRNLAANLELSHANLALSDREVVLAQELQRAERKLLANGASNLFLVNAREEKAAEAQMKNVLSYKYALKASGAYDAATLNYKELEIAPPLRPAGT